MTDKFTAGRFAADQFTTLADAKKWLNAGVADGVECPCCGQLARLYKRRLNASMAYVLSLIYRWQIALPPERRGSEWLHVPSHIASQVGKDDTGGRQTAAIRGDWAKLKHWGLIEEQPGKRDDGSKRMGYYRITPQGIAFVQGQSVVQAYIYVYNEMVINIPVTERVTFREALSVRFNFDQLMAGV